MRSALQEVTFTQAASLEVYLHQWPSPSKVDKTRENVCAYYFSRHINEL